MSTPAIEPVAGTTARPAGLPKLADVPVPSVEMPAPPPASVVTTPPGKETVRIRLGLLPPPSSATMIMLELRAATATGDQKLAAVPTPLVLPCAPLLPASVETTAPGYVTRRMRKLSLSATTMVPDEADDSITATLLGLQKLAAVPTPSKSPAVLLLPASVETTPPGYVTSRMRLFVVSATTLVPDEGITATSASPAKLAAVPTPSLEPPLDEPPAL